MFIRHLTLRNFRNYEEAHVEFSPQLNLITGDNAQGKSSLLEAIYFIITGRSFRTRYLSELIQNGATGFYLQAEIVKHEVDQTLKIFYSPKKRQIIYNSTEYPSLNSLLGLLQGVLLSSEDSELIKGLPSDRRGFIDLQIAQGDPLYLYHLNRYFRAMKHRNALLKAKQLLTIESWEHEMSSSAAYLIYQRKSLIDELGNRCPKLQEQLSLGTEKIGLDYRSAFALESMPQIQEKLIEEMRRQRPKEFYLGYTLVGPHREDLSFLLDGRAAFAFASEGQQRCLLAALKLGELHRLHKQSGEMPIMGVDDFENSLDLKRRKQLLNYLKDLGQVFLTSPREIEGEELSGRIVAIHKGTIAS